MNFILFYEVRTLCLKRSQVLWSFFWIKNFTLSVGCFSCHRLSCRYLRLWSNFRHSCILVRFCSFRISVCCKIWLTVTSTKFSLRCWTCRHSYRLVRRVRNYWVIFFNWTNTCYSFNRFLDRRGRRLCRQRGFCLFSRWLIVASS